MSAGVLLPSGLVLSAVLVYIVRRSGLLAGALAAAAALILAWTAWQWSAGTVIDVAGRDIYVGQAWTVGNYSLRITDAARLLLVVFGVSAAASFLFACRISQGYSFFPIGLVLLAGYIATISLEPRLWMPALLACLTPLGAFAIQAGRAGSTTAAHRHLWLPLLALPAFLLVPFYTAQFPLNPDDIVPQQTAARLLAFGLFVLLAPAPLHGPLLAMVKDAPPLVSAFLSILGQGTVIFLARALLLEYPWITQHTDLVGWVGLAGLLTAVWSGVGALVQRDFGRLWAYANLHGWALVLIGFVISLLDPQKWPLLLFLFATRSAAALLGAMGLASLRYHAMNDDFELASGVGFRLPWTTIALMGGGLGMAGFPLTASFAAHWALLQAVAEYDWQDAAVVLLGSAGVIVGYIRGLRYLLGPLRDWRVEREGTVITGLLICAITGTILLGLAPQLLADPIATGMQILDISQITD